MEAEVAADYMGQAEGLLKEGQPGKFDHVSAAVLAGAALEKTLRTFCNEQPPPVSAGSRPYQSQRHRLIKSSNLGLLSEMQPGTTKC
ncbi:MAG TPA: hypothetical protein VJX28_07125 [Chthoniobacterales bacterium]|nr:hypothetical protein [Chthoniobacterales bacterium]